MLKKIFLILFGDKNEMSSKIVLSDRTYLIDVRAPAEFAQGSVKGAINIPLDGLQKKNLKLDRERSIVVFCRSGNRSRQAKSILEQQGFKNVVDGGNWKNVDDAMTNHNQKAR